VGSHAYAGIGLLSRMPLVRAAVCVSAPEAVGSSVARGVTLGSTLGSFPPFCPECELPAIAHLNGDVGRIPA